MKKVRTFRINEDVEKLILVIAEEQGITFSQFVELACYSLLDEKKLPNKIIEKAKEKNSEKILVDFKVNHNTFKKLAEIVQEKNTTFSQEIRFRLSATLEKSIFSEQEFSKLWQVRNDLNSLGNLFRLAIKSNVPMDEVKLNEMRQLVIETKSAFDEILVTMNERML